MVRHTHSVVTLAGATLWWAWVVAHYYARVPFTLEIADGVRGSSFPYWRDALVLALTSIMGAIITVVAAVGFGWLLLAFLRRAERSERPSAALFENAAERAIYALFCGFLVLSS